MSTFPGALLTHSVRAALVAESLCAAKTEGSPGPFAAVIAGT